MSQPPITIALPLWARALLILGGFAMLGLGTLGAAASVYERDLGLLALVVGIFGPVGLGWIFLVRVGLRRVQVTDDAVIVRNVLLSHRARLDALQHHTHDGPLRLHHTSTGRPQVLVVRLLIRDLQTRVLEAVEARSKSLRDARVARRCAGVPVDLRARREAIWTNVVGTIVLTAMMGILAVGGGYEAVQSGLGGAWSEAAIGLAMGGMGGLFALLFLWIFATRFIWRWRFTATHVGELRSIGWRRYPVAELEAMELKSETRVMKGVSRQAWLLEFRFAGDRTIRVEPTENGLPARFAPVDDHRELSDLEQRLRPVYFPKEAESTPAPIAANLPRNAPGPPYGLAPLDALLAMSSVDRAMQGETIRDALAALGASATPTLLAAARRSLSQDSESDVADVILLSLTDRGEAAAWPVYVDALDHRSAYIRFVAACGLDAAAGGRFRIADRCIHGGHIDHDGVDAWIPALQKWWRSEGDAAYQQRLPQDTPRPPTPPRAQRWNFIAMNPTWVMEAGGTVHAPSPGTKLPRAAAGVHVVGGTVRAQGRLETVDAVFELSATTGEIVGVFVRTDGTWHPVPRPWTQATPRFTVAA